MDFDCIYKSYYLDVYHFLCGLSSNKEIAEDITQETFTKALAAIDSYDGRKDIRAWLFTIARNTYFTYCKREKIYVEWECSLCRDEINKLKKTLVIPTNEEVMIARDTVRLLGL